MQKYVRVNTEGELNVLGSENIGHRQADFLLCHLNLDSPDEVDMGSGPMTC